MSDFAKMNSALQTALKQIGNEGEHAAPKSQDPFDAALHEYYVAKMGEKFFKDRAEKALDKAMDGLGDHEKKVIADMVKATKDNGAGESAVIAGGQHYVFDLTTRKGATRLDNTALKNALQVKHGMPGAVVEKLFADCSKSNEPSKMFTVKPVRD